MSQQLMMRAPLTLGLLGRIVGLLYSYAVMSDNGYACSLCSTDADWSFVQPFIGTPLIIGSAVGLAACILYPVARKPSGIFLLSGAILASPLPVIIAVGSWQILGSLILLSVLLFPPNYLASLLLFLGGLLTFQKTRHVIKSLHDGGWIP